MAVDPLNPGIWGSEPAIQFDAVLHKQNLRWDHQTWNMPVVNDFLFTRLCHEGLIPGLVYGIDDFIYDARATRLSVSEVLVVCSVDQHFTDDFLKAFRKLTHHYRYRILINIESIYSPLSYYESPEKNSVVKHERFLKEFDPDVICYASLLDCAEYRKRGVGRARTLFYPLADWGIFGHPVLPWEQKQHAILYTGKPSAWEQTKESASGWTRAQQVQYFQAQNRIPMALFHETFTFRSCYHLANLYRFQLSPKSGFFFHTPRVIQAMALQSIPIILLQQGQMEWLEREAPWLVPDRHCLIGFDGDYEDVLRKTGDLDLCRSIASNLNEISDRFSASTAIRELVGWVRREFLANDHEPSVPAGKGLFGLGKQRPPVASPRLVTTPLPEPVGDQHGL